MKRGTLVALGILVALVVVYFVTSDEPRQQEVAPLTIEKVENLDRIEIAPPKESGQGNDGTHQKKGSQESDGGDRPSLIAFESREDGWWLTKPVEAPASESFAKTVDEQLKQTIQTDDLPIDSSQKASYDLDDKSSARLALYGGGSESPQVELLVGKQIEVEGTGAVRTYIRQAGSEDIYRAQVELGDFVRKSVDDFRSESILDLNKDAVTRLAWTPDDGPEMVLEKQEDSWTMVSPQVDWSLDTSAVDGILGALAGLNADSFADDKQLSEIGLEPPVVELTAETDEGSTSLLVGSVDGADGTTYYAKRADSRFKYEISTYAGQKLIADLGDLRSKTPRTFDQKAISEVRFPGGEDVVVRKEGDGWTLVRPEADESLNDKKLERKLSALASLKVKDFPDVEPAEVGLGAGAERLSFETDGGSHAILFGDTVDEGGDRYVKFADGDEVYLVTKFTAEKLHPSVDDLVGKAQGPSKMPGGLKGMHGKGGRGGGMNKLQKMKMMQQLKRKMGK